MSVRSGCGFGGERGAVVRVFGIGILGCLPDAGRFSGGPIGRRGEIRWTPMVAAEAGRSGAAPLRHEMLDYASIRRQEQIMLWVRACHRATVLTFATLRTRNRVSPRLRA